MISHRNIIIYLFLALSQQFWTIKYQNFSLPMIMISLLGLVCFRSFFKINILIYIVLFYFSASAIINAHEWKAEYIQYTPYFSLISLGFWLCGAAILLNIRDSLPRKLFGKISFICIVVAFIGVLIMSPQSAISPQDGIMGFFNEKGLFGFYISLLSCSLYFYSKSKFRFGVIVLFLIYTVFVIESARSLLIYVGFFILLFSDRKIKHSSFFILAILAFFSVLYFNGQFDSLIGKLEIIAENSGNIGRYAAAFVTTQLNTNELLFGTGFGTYLHTRNLFIEVLPGIDYDYAGSFLLEMIIEVGLIQAIILFLGLTNFLYNTINIKLLATVILISLVGGKQDLQMIFGFIMFSLFYRKIKEENATSFDKNNDQINSPLYGNSQ
jgi:hypothetical protein